MMTSHLPDQPSVSCARQGGDGEHALPGLALGGQPGRPAWQGPAGPWVFAGEHSPGAGRGTGEPNHSPKHTWVPTGKCCVSSLCSYCAKTTAPRTRGADSLEQEAEKQHPGHGSPRSARAPLLKPWVGVDPPSPRKPAGISPPAAAERCTWESPNRLRPGQTDAAACA